MSDGFTPPGRRARVQCRAELPVGDCVLPKPMSARSRPMIQKPFASITMPSTVSCPTMPPVIWASARTPRRAGGCPVRWHPPAAGSCALGLPAVRFHVPVAEGLVVQRDIPLCRVAGKAFFQMFQLSGAVLHDRTAQHPVLPFTKTFGISIAQSVKIGNNCPCTQ